jgi:hypothetical protein
MIQHKKYVMLCNVVTHISEEHSTCLQGSVPEDGCSIFLRNTGNHLSHHTISSQKTAVSLFISARTSNRIHYPVHKNLPLGPILSQMNGVYTLLVYHLPLYG